MFSLNFKLFLEGRVPDEGTKAVLFEKATTVGIPVRRGEIGEIGSRGFRTDPGDFGRGVYYMRRVGRNSCGNRLLSLRTRWF